MASLSDQWTNEIHLLGYEDFAAKVIGLIRATDTPFSIAINGRWGAGKTSLLRTMMQSLGGKGLSASEALFCHTEEWPENGIPQELVPNDSDNEHIKTIWFNPWQYQNETNPLIPLLHEIRKQLTPTKKVIENAKDAATVALDAALHSFGDLFDNVVNFAMGRKLVNMGEKVTHNLQTAHSNNAQNRFSEPVDAQRFFLQFEMAVKKAINHDGEKPGARLVIFIDDLDRCSDETVFSLLEAIKLYLSSKYCVFVFGLDRAHVENAIARVGTYNQQEAARYVDKMFQVRLQLPWPKIDKLKGFIKGLLELNQQKVKEDVIDILVEILPPNPRMIKSFINGLSLYEKLTPKDDSEDDHQFLVRLALMHAMRTIYPDCYELLHQSAATTLQVLSKFSDDNNWVCDNEMQAYLKNIFDNPIYEIRPPSGDSDKGENIKLESERFLQIRATSFRAEAADNFLKRFVKRFNAQPESANLIARYLV